MVYFLVSSGPRTNQRIALSIKMFFISYAQLPLLQKYENLTRLFLHQTNLS